MSERDEMLEALMDAAAHLIGAAFAYRRHASRHASVGLAMSDPMYTTRVKDFERAAKKAQTAVRKFCKH